MNIQNELMLRKPVSVWNRPLKIDPKKFLLKLSKAAIKGLQCEFEDAGENLAEALIDVKPEEEAAQLAWLLIYRSLSTALKDLLYDSRDLFPLQGTDDSTLDALTDSLNDHLLNLEVGISADFFQHPQQLPLLHEFSQAMQQWLKGLGLSPNQAQALAQRLPDKFALELHSEWLKDVGHYSTIKTAIDTPFTQAAQKQRQWLHYQAWLREQLNQRMFFEAFSLQSVYIPLRAYYEEKPNNEIDRPAIAAEQREVERHVVDLQSELETWVHNFKADDYIRIISGGPGSGKSSFCKTFATHIAEATGIKVLFVPLHLFDITSDLIDSVERFVSKSRYLDGSPLHARDGEERLLVIFDGLDELSMQGKEAMQAAQDFVDKVVRDFESFASQGLKRQVLISGRDLVVQTNSAKFHMARQILHLLPYIVENKETSRYRYVDKHRLLACDQRQIWWAKYCSVSGKGYSNMPEALKGNNLAEITRWPLLNYLVSLSFDRKELDFNSETSLNLVYQDSLKAVYERQYENRRRHQGTGRLDFANFCHIFEEIALAVWHDDGKKTTIEYIQSRCNQSSLHHYIEEFQDSADKGLTRLLIAFYCRQSEEIKGNKTFEFTHKSFGEYLTACRLVRMVKEIQLEMERHKENWDTRKALEHWAGLCGQTAIDEYLKPFINNQVALSEPNIIKKWQYTIARLIESTLSQGMPMEKQGLNNFHQMLGQSRNAEEALLVLHSACALQTRDVSNIDFPTLEAFGNWIHRLRGQRSGSESTGMLKSLVFLNLFGCSLYYQDLYKANLQGANLRRAHLEKANLEEAHLQGADLQKANLQGANLQGANLQGANLQGANLQGANLQGANLQGADLKGAHLEGAHLQMANLEGALLQEADLYGALVQGAHLEGAHLEGALLQMAHLQGADLEGADLKGANLQGANLKRANLQRANLKEANFYEANLEGVTIKEANYREAYLYGAHLEGAIF